MDIQPVGGCFIAERLKWLSIDAEYVLPSANVNTSRTEVDAILCYFLSRRYGNVCQISRRRQMLALETRKSAFLIGMHRECQTRQIPHPSCTFDFRIPSW
jgi:hypothetical protein